MKSKPKPPPIMGGFCIGGEENDRRFRMAVGGSRTQFQYIAPPDTEKWKKARMEPYRSKMLATINQIEKKTMDGLLLLQWFRLLIDGGWVHRDVLADINRVRKGDKG